MINLTSQSIKALFPSAVERSYSKGQIICYIGDKPQHVFFISKGHVRYYDIDDQGREKVLHFMGPHNIFPMLFAFGVTSEVGAFYAALDGVQIIAIPLAEFHDAVDTNIAFSNSLTRWFLTEINQLVYRISSLEKTDARIKILYALKYLAANYGNQQRAWQRLNMPVTHQFIADLTGLARETVSNTMRDLETEKIIIQRKLKGIDIKKSELDKLS